MKEDNEDKKTQLSPSSKELIEGQNNDTFSSTMLKLINGKKVPSDEYFRSEN